MTSSVSAQERKAYKQSNTNECQLTKRGVSPWGEAPLFLFYNYHLRHNPFTTGKLRLTKWELTPFLVTLMKLGMLLGKKIERFILPVLKEVLLVIAMWMGHTLFHCCTAFPWRQNIYRLTP